MAAPRRTAACVKLLRARGLTCFEAGLVQRTLVFVLASLSLLLVLLFQRRRNGDGDDSLPAPTRRPASAVVEAAAMQTAEALATSGRPPEADSPVSAKSTAESSSGVGVEAGPSQGRTEQPPQGQRLPGPLPSDPNDPAGPMGVFRDWVAAPATKEDGAVVGVVLLKHKSVHVYNFDMLGAPDWAKQIFAVTRLFCLKHGHKMVLREGGRSAPTPWQTKRCEEKYGRNSEAANVTSCERGFDRDNNCWEKCNMMAQYLERSRAKHVMILDADAALIHKSRDSIQSMIEELDRAGKDILLANEDYKKNGGPARLNCAMMFARNTEYARQLFRNLVEMHLQGPAYTGPYKNMNCNSECHCLQLLLKSDEQFRDRLLVVSGTRYNRQECTFRCCTSCPTNTAVEGLNKRPFDDPDLDVLHFTSGNSRGAVRHFLKERVDCRGEVKSFMDTRVPDYLPDKA